MRRRRGVRGDRGVDVLRGFEEEVDRRGGLQGPRTAQGMRFLSALCLVIEKIGNVRTEL